MSGGDIGTGNHDAGAVQQEDDGFTAEERAQFDAMRNETPMPASTETEGGDVGTGGDDGAGGGAAQPGVVEASPDGVVGESEDDDGDDGAEAGAGAQQQPGKDGKPPPRRVPYRRFAKAEEERDAARREAEEAKLTLARFNERMAILNEAIGGQQQQQQKKEDDDPEPNPEEDLFGYNAWLKRRLDKTNERFSQLETQQRERDQQQQVERSYFSDSQRFAQKEPAFLPAYQFLMQNRYAELGVYYFRKQPSELTAEEQARIMKTITDEERELVSSALGQGHSPAEFIFSIAKARGFAPPAKEEVKPEAGKTNGAAKTAVAGKPARAPGSLADAAETVSQELKRVQKGVEASVSLSDGGGAPPPAALTPEAIANMPQDEFNELMEKLSPAQAKQVMGG